MSRSVIQPKYQKGELIRINEDNSWFADEYGLTMGKTYEVVRFNQFWDSVTIVNDIGENMGVDVRRIERV